MKKRFSLQISSQFTLMKKVGAHANKNCSPKFKAINQVK